MATEVLSERTLVLTDELYTVVEDETSSDNDKFDCPICWQRMRDPRMCTHCTNVFCSPCLKNWQITSKTSVCPLCKRGEKFSVCPRTFVQMVDDVVVSCVICSSKMKRYDFVVHLRNHLPKVIDEPTPMVLEPPPIAQRPVTTNSRRPLQHLSVFIRTPHYWINQRFTPYVDFGKSLAEIKKDICRKFEFSEEETTIYDGAPWDDAVEFNTTFRLMWHLTGKEAGFVPGGNITLFVERIQWRCETGLFDRPHNREYISMKECSSINWRQFTDSCAVKVFLDVNQCVISFNDYMNAITVSEFNPTIHHGKI